MIDVKNLTMCFGSLKALDNVSFSVGDHEILGLLGPNGAGKTTAMRILTTYLLPTAGSVEVSGIDVIRNPTAVRKLIGYLPETVPLYYDLEVIEYIEFIGRARGLEGQRFNERLEWVVNACNIRDVLRKPIGELSKGFRQRVALAQALIHDPQVLILDEPTSGLDPLQIQEIRSLIKDLAATKTVIFSTHILYEVESVTDRVCIINEGKIIADGKISEFRSNALDGRKFIIQLEAPQAEVESFFKGFAPLKNFSINGVNGTVVTATIEIGRDADKELYNSLKVRGWTIQTLTETLPSFEETFVRFIKESKRVI